MTTICLYEPCDYDTESPEIVNNYFSASPPRCFLSCLRTSALSSNLRRVSLGFSPRRLFDTMKAMTSQSIRMILDFVLSGFMILNWLGFTKSNQNHKDTDGSEGCDWEQIAHYASSAS